MGMHAQESCRYARGEHRADQHTLVMQNKLSLAGGLGPRCWIKATTGRPRVSAS
jgi:hypothetical protein